MKCILKIHHIQTIEYEVDMNELVKHGVETDDTDLISVAYDYWHYPLGDDSESKDEWEVSEHDPIEGAGDIIGIRDDFEERVEKMMVIK